MVVRARLNGRTVALVFTALMAIGIAPVNAGFFEVPDQKHGTYGAYTFGAGVCKYKSLKGPDTLTAIKVSAPSLFWPDRRSAPNEHGKVTWRIELFDATTGKRIKSSKLYSAIASETTKAPFVAKSIAITPQPGHVYNTWAKAVWYKPDGRVLGSVRHFVFPYKHSTAAYQNWCTDSA